MSDAVNRSMEFYCGSSPPQAAVILKDLNLPAIILYSVLTLMAVIANLVYFEEVIYLLRKVPSTNRRATIMWVSGAAPVIASTSCIGMWVPLASMITDLTTAVYFAIVIHKFQRMMIEEFGGDESFLRHFKNTPVKISTAPCCCCCLCLPFGTISRRMMFLLKLGTFQLAFLRPVLMIFTLVLWVNGTFSLDDFTPSGPAIWINTFLGVSTIIALWPIGIVFNKVKGELKNQKIIPKFTLYQHWSTSFVSGLDQFLLIFFLWTHLQNYLRAIFMFLIREPQQVISEEGSTGVTVFWLNSPSIEEDHSLFECSSTFKFDIANKIICIFLISFILTQLQATILNITALSGGIACAPPLSPTVRAGYMTQQLLIMEMFIITMLSRIYYRRKYDPQEINEIQSCIKTEKPQTM